ncbi:MAG: hypothetical protein AAB556_02015 [Patescibacteria group bacterium]
MKNLTTLLVVVAILFSAVPAIAQMTVSQMAMSADDGQVSKAVQSRSRYRGFVGPHDGCAIRGRHVHDVNWAPASVAARPNSVPSDSTVPSSDEKLGEHEVMRVFLDKGFASAPNDASADFIVEIRAFTEKRLKCPSYGYRYSNRRICYLEPERVVYITVKDKEDKSIAVGEGDDKELRQAVRDAAENALDKIKEKGKSVYIYDFS